MDILSERLRSKREEQRVTQDDLANHLGFKSGKQAVSRWERGVAEPSIPQMIQIAALLKTTVAYMIGETSEETPEPLIPADKILVSKDDYIRLLEQVNRYRQKEEQAANSLNTKE